MLDIKRVLASTPKKPEDVKLVELRTPWADAAAKEVCRNDLHPHPQFARESFTTLNGLWDYAIVPGTESPDASTAPSVWDGHILVPFSPEALLSGIGHVLTPNERLWYRRTFEAPEELACLPGARCLLHFEAVDWQCAVWVNDRLVGTHTGGYLPFAFDITDALHEETNEVTVCVHDPSETGVAPRGKQRLARGGIWYTAQSGIWQSVWLEVVPQVHLVGLKMSPVPSEAHLDLELSVVAPEGTEITLGAVLRDKGSEVGRSEAQVRGAGAHHLMIALSSVHLWNPKDPFLYDLELVCNTDHVESYCAFRTVEVRADESGIPRLFLNDEPLFLRGLLDQGYWSDGLMTAPADEALVFDIKTAKDLGFNMVRKHIKVECDRWYYHCDRLGMLVWQDMVQGGEVPPSWRSSYLPTLWRRSWDRFADDQESHFADLASASPDYRREWTETCAGTVGYLSNHPSVITWVLFNEAWGQFESEKACEMVRDLDPTRPIDATSGWYDQGGGDFLSVHNYFRTLEVYPDKKAARMGRPPRAFVISEFGGLSWRAEGHCSLESSYGYDTFEDAEAFSRALCDLLATVDHLRDKGLAGFVYTQLSDVEEETNGLVSYDRRVNKVS